MAKKKVFFLNIIHAHISIDQKEIGCYTHFLELWRFLLPYKKNQTLENKLQKHSIKFNPHSPMMEFLYRILLSEEVFNKMNIFGFIFEKKLTLVQKPQNIFLSVQNDASRRRVQVFF